MQPNEKKISSLINMFYEKIIRRLNLCKKKYVVPTYSLTFLSFDSFPEATHQQHRRSSTYGRARRHSPYILLTPGLRRLTALVFLSITAMPVPTATDSGWRRRRRAAGGGRRRAAAGGGRADGCRQWREELTGRTRRNRSPTRAGRMTRHYQPGGPTAVSRSRSQGD